MKPFCLFIMLFLATFHFVNAQTFAHIAPPEPKVIEPVKVKITDRYTSTFIFPFTILKYDVGSDEVQAMKLSRLENVLLVKSTEKGFTPTNVTVFTKDAGIYSLLVAYDSTPPEFTYLFAKDSLVYARASNNLTPVTILSDAYSESTLHKDFALLERQKKFLSRTYKEGKVRLSLDGLYLKDDLLWMNFTLRNQSMIDYRPDLLKISIVDRKKFKRTAVQEFSIDTVASNLPESISGNSFTHFSLAFRPFTVPQKKRLKISLTELGGGRVMNLQLKSGEILRTRRLL